ncbi:cholesterol oxidase substrate-binding domain-containing protein [Aldersonia kunmingensis]|uniref:cholesterol oxidase substrate-binding domain-containing protein n=1 Tax=Aldersonia kunmingensis TaxID=408066 RepID=UPI00082F8E37|nr:cholesterol oxidase substrate-binding domain-containing protein [Aldersonia kunmingensis]
MPVSKKSAGLSRRGFLAAGAGALAVTAMGGWTPVYALPSGSSGGATLPEPPNFPSGIDLTQQAYENWSKEIQLDSVWTATPKNANDVVTLTNWAHANGYTLRPRGAMHGWTPLTVVQGASVAKVILVDTTKHLNGVVVNGGSPATVTAGAGATLDDITTALQNDGLGIANLPAPGVLTIGGALAVNAHGAALPAEGQSTLDGHTYGSLSNLVTSLTAVVWNGTEYAERTFTRSDPKIKPLLTALGRTFITSVTLQAGPNLRMRCQSYTDIPWTELFAAKGASGRTFESFVKANGGAEAIWYPFTEKPWMKVWSVAPTKPAASREVTGPYNYPFSDNLGDNTADLIGGVTSGSATTAPTFGSLMYSQTVSGLKSSESADIWGWSKDVQFYIKASTLRLTEGGGAVITKRENIGKVIHEFAEWFNDRVEYYRDLGEYPLNGPVEIRCCGLDEQGDVKVATAGGPTISSVRPRQDHPEWDTAIWLNVLGVPGTKGMFAFYREMEQWMRSHFTGSEYAFRPEWSKGWAFTDAKPYTNGAIISNDLPNSYREGVPGSDNWDTAVAVFNEFDPNRVYSNTFMDQLLP